MIPEEKFTNAKEVDFFKDLDEEKTMTKQFWIAAGIRALRTVCQTAVSVIGVSAVLSEVDWLYVGSASVLAGIASVLTSIATGLPEV